MDAELLHIGPADAHEHAAFCTFVQSVFRGADFRPWVARGGWDDDYGVWALRSGDRLVASVGVTRMRLMVDGRALAGWQLGAVATAPEARGRGLARRLLDAALAATEAGGAAPVFLFANPSVLDFYPRFGFRRVLQQRHAADVAVAPSGDAVAWDVADPATRARLAAHCARALPLDTAFAAHYYYATALWHLCHRPRRVLHLPDIDAVAVVRVEDDVLYFDDFYTTQQHDLRALLPRLVDRPVRRVEFGFRPGAAWHGATACGPDPEPLFVRGFALPGDVTDLRFPVLAHT